MFLHAKVTLIGAILMAAGPFALSAGAAEGKTPETPKPAAEMKALAFFDGNWTCDGAAQPSPFGPGGKMTSTVRVHDDLGGFWQSGKVKGSMPGLPPLEGLFHTTYDPAAKEFVMLWVDNAGAWSRSTSKGWQGDKIVYEGEMSMGGQKTMARDTFSKGADGSMKHLGEVQVEGKWAAMFEETCKKAAK